MTTTNEKNIAAFLHLSALTQYVIPFGNYIFPIVIWSSKKNESEFVDQNGKQVLNFQLSIFLYMVVLCLIAIPIFIYSIFKNVPMNDINFNRNYVIENLSAGNITGITILGIIAVLLFFFLKVIEFILIIYAAVKASNGEAYKYPLSIPFFK
ncbi:DUF4870 domain-containing protein [Flavobacterium sp. J49]|uniref:DUF4870 domain-containing protein n=1 Tax=Flavobacterium sp. J49 TaxID=2718534 RepID=UPI0015941F02|nr:DUF4870 domain-containing protein [Flavobacterium sp. J49]MBF6642430.1 DUF4870 domain-containing protein [Flavobacterium sp. J49]NIC03676.1 DUF4870 domain-containing protein [Flavobacterium sp. J49]